MVIRKIFASEEIAEYALYREPGELQLELDFLQLSDPQKVELYSLVVAGYGPEGVFRHEGSLLKMFTECPIIYSEPENSTLGANFQGHMYRRPSIRDFT